LAISSSLSAPRHRGQTMMSTANTRCRSHAQGVTARRFGAGLELGRLAIEQQLQLRQLHGELGRGTTGDDFAARVGMSREHAVIAQQMEARRRDQGDEPTDEVERVEQHGMRAVTSSSLESIQ
jgi:hypothetical protein